MLDKKGRERERIKAMQDDFLNELFGIVGFTEEEKAKLREDLKAILSANISSAFFQKLNKEEKKSLGKHLKENLISKESLVVWLQTYGYQNNEEMVKILAETIKHSLKDFLSAIVSELDENKKAAVTVLVNKYLKGE